MFIVLCLVAVVLSQYDCVAGRVFKEGENNFPSWCRYQNPLSSYPGKRWFDNVETIDNFFFVDPNITKFDVDEYCEGNEPYSKCQCVVDIHYIEFSETLKNLMFFLKHGKIVYSDYVSHFLEVLIDLNDEIKIVSPLYMTDTYRSALILSSADFVYLMDFSIDPLGLFPEVTLCNKIEIKENYEISNMRMVNNLEGSYYALMQYKILDALNLHKFEFIQFDGVCNNNTNVEYTWDITTNDASTFLQFDITTHSVWLDHTEDSLFIKEASRKRNVLFILNDGTSVHFIPFAVQNFQIDLSSKTQLTRFFQALHNRVISHTNFIGGEIRQVRMDSTCGDYKETESQPMSLVTVELDHFANISYFSVTDLIEFSEQTFEGEVDFLNYANRPIEAVACLDSNKYYNSDLEECVTRTARKDELEYEITTSTTVFVSTITEAGEDMDRHLNLKYFCGYYMKTGKLGFEDEGTIRECLEYNDTRYNCDLEKIKYNPNLREILLSNMWYTNIYLVAAYDSLVYVYSYGYDIDENDYYFEYPFDYFMHQISRIEAQGEISKILVTRNSYYAFLSINRYRWEIDSRLQQVKVCKAIKKGKFEALLDKNNEDQYDMLKYATDACTFWAPTKPTFNDFAYYLSSCPKGIHCLSMRKSVAESVERGYFSLKPFFKEPCPPGSYCISGTAIPCPKGFYCDEIGLYYPKICTPDKTEFTTCWFEGTIVDRIMCPPGLVCTSKYSQPIPIPPGYKQDLDIHFNSTMNSTNTMDYIIDNYEWIIEKTMNTSSSGNTFSPCERGEWCPIAMFFDNLCPAGTLCKKPSVVVPKKCKYKMPTRYDGTDPGWSDYCPAGSYNKSTIGCPPGYYCRVVNKTRCTNRYLCEYGTLVEIPCIAGYYCPTPEEKIMCPMHHFCPTGSVAPKRCSLFSICPAGSKVNNLNILDLLLILAIFVGVYITYAVCKKIEELCNKKSDRKREKNRSGSINTDDGDISFVRLQDEKMIQIEEENVKGGLEEFKINLSFKKLRLTLKSNGAIVVNDVTGTFGSGTVTAVMGLSGCGKTSIITTLAGKAYYGTTGGDIFVNGVKTGLNKLKKMVAFVPQEDVMYRMMSVEETLSFSARTRSKGGVKGVKKKVDHTLQILGLDEIRNSRIGDENVRGISGGQRKRVNIGIELVSDPVVLFLDEPTSSQEVCDSLKRIASNGVTVITVIHQPRYEIFCQFDNLMLLGKGGFVIYCGKVSDSEKYFQSLGYVCPPKINPADYFLDACSGRVLNNKGEKNTQEFFVQQWKDNQENLIENRISDEVEKSRENESSNTNKLKKELKSRKRNYFVQFIESLKRAIIMRFRDLKGFYLDNGLIIFGGLILGALFSGDTSDIYKIFSMCAMISLLLSLCAIMGSLSTFGSEKAVFIRENNAGLSSLCHFISFNIVDLFSNLVGPLNFCFIFFFLASPKGSFWMYYLICFVVHFTTYGLGYPISIIFGNNSRIASIVVLVVLNMLSGLVEQLPVMKTWTPPLCWAPYGSYVLYSTESVYLVEIAFFRQFFNLDKLVKDGLGYDYNNIYYTIPLIFSFGIFFRIVGYLLLVQIYPPDSLYNKLKRFLEKYFGRMRYFVTKGILNGIRKCFKKKNIINEDLEKSLLGESVNSVVVENEIHTI